jgi:hypothetical protein
MLIDAPFNSVTHGIIAAAIEVHRVLGPGLLESAYTPCLQVVHEAQLLTYLNLSALPAGLPINFNVPKLVDGVRRVVNPKVANRG